MYKDKYAHAWYAGWLETQDFFFSALPHLVVTMLLFFTSWCHTESLNLYARVYICKLCDLFIFRERKSPHFMCGTRILTNQMRVRAFCSKSWNLYKLWMVDSPSVLRWTLCTHWLHWTQDSRANIPILRCHSHFQCHMRMTLRVSIQFSVPTRGQ